jgi:hypothetical protein
MNFAEAIASYVRALPDDALLELVRERLQQVGGEGAPERAAPESAPPARPARGSDLAARVEEVVRRSGGIALADVARGVGEADKRRVATVLRSLRAQGRVACAGDRRTARWARDQATADAAVGGS